MLDKMPRKAQIIVLGFLGMMLFFAGIKYQESRLNSLNIETLISAEEESREKLQPEEDAPAVKLLTVHVVGAVEKPGVYSLESGKRVDDVLKMALPTAKADLSLLNLAAPLADGKQIYVPVIGEKQDAHSTFAASSRGNASQININTAGINELDKLPGIGPALAQRIIDYRESKGLFTSINDLTKVSGIGPAVFAKLKDKICTE